MKLFEFKPKLVSCLKNYSKETFMADLMAAETWKCRIIKHLKKELSIDLPLM